jgi:hypothetical protein
VERGLAIDDQIASKPSRPSVGNILANGTCHARAGELDEGFAILEVSLTRLRPPRIRPWTTDTAARFASLVRCRWSRSSALLDPLLERARHGSPARRGCAASRRGGANEERQQSNGTPTSSSRPVTTDEAQATGGE